MRIRSCTLLTLSLVFTFSSIYSVVALEPEPVRRSIQAVSGSGTFNGQLVNSRTATATVYLVQRPSIDIEKSTTGEDADDPLGPFVTGGDTLTWTYRVTNTGNVTLTNIVVTDSEGVSVDCGDGTNVIPTLAPSTSVTCTAIGAAQIGQRMSTGAASTTFTKASSTMVKVADSDNSYYYGLQPGEPSIQINSLISVFDDAFTQTSGVFNITNESEKKTDGFLIGLESYQIDWEFKKGPQDPYEPSTLNASDEGSLFINDQEVTYICTYSLMDVDGDTSVARDLSLDENLVFHESINIGYTCWFSAPIPNSGFLRGTASAAIFGQDERAFTFSEEFPLRGASALAPAAPNAVPRETRVHQNFRNPFNPDTWIPFELSEDARVKIEIHDVTGRLVRTLDLGHRPAGYYLEKSKAAYWDGRNEAGESVASGIYFYQFTAGDFSAMKRMVILK